MAHFAQLDETASVISVVVVSNADILDSDGKEVEAMGVAICEAVIGSGQWVQTSYNNRIRRRYAGIGMVYSQEHDTFLLPQPYPSWVLDLSVETDWVAPVPMPTDEGYWYEWDEDNLAWIAHETIEEPIGEE